MIPQEIDALKEMDHPHIIKPYQIFEDQRHLYIVTEYIYIYIYIYLDYVQVENYLTILFLKIVLFQN